MARPKGVRKHNTKSRSNKNVANFDFASMYLKPGAQVYLDRLYDEGRRLFDEDGFLPKCYNNPYYYVDYDGYGFEDEDGKGYYRPLTVDECEELCYGCPLIKLCYDFAVANDEKHGVWGGVNFAENSDDLFDMEENI